MVISQVQKQAADIKNIIAMLALFLIIMFGANKAYGKNTEGVKQKNEDFIVTLLGTGSPVPRATRFSMSTLVEVGGKNFLFDAGRGSLIRLRQAGLLRGDLDVIFLTHLHSDHTVGLPDLLLTGWLMDSFHKTIAQKPLNIYGPGPIKGRIGTKAMIHRIKKAYEADIYIREHDAKLSSKGLNIHAHNFGPIVTYDKVAGVVYHKDGITVKAFKVDHGPYAKPAYGYRINYDGRSVLLSGDTNYKPNESLIKAARGVDLLVHEVLDVNKNIKNKNLAHSIKRHHTLPEQAGKVFSKIQPKLAVYSHIVQLQNGKILKKTIQDIRKKTRNTYKGPLHIGNDLDSIVITSSGVVLHPRSWTIRRGSLLRKARN